MSKGGWRTPAARCNQAAMLMKTSAILLACLSCGHASAGDIGFASNVDRTATGELGAERRSLDRGSRVRTQEVLTTDAAGRLSIQFFDRTLLTMGPQSRVKLDRFVVKADGSAREVALNATQGAFRFATGISDSRAYRILTPAGVMGVRGTRFAFEIERGRLRVSVSEGAVQVCPPNASANACRIARPGSDVVIANRRASVAPSATGIANLAPPLLTPLTAIPGDLPRFNAVPGLDAPVGGAGLPPSIGASPGAPGIGLPTAPSIPSLPGGGLLRR